MRNTNRIYDAIRRGDPKAVEFYQTMKQRVLDGERAKMVVGAIQFVHEQRKAGMLPMRTSVGAAYPPGSYLTPNGKVLTPDVISQLVAAAQSLLSGGTMTMATNPDAGVRTSSPGGSLSLASNPLARQVKPAATKVTSTANKGSLSQQLGMSRAIASLYQ